MSDAIRIVVLDGDETGQELLEESLRVLDSELLGLEVELERFDLSLENRRATQNGVVERVGGAMRDAGLGIKAATITPEGREDVGTPEPDRARGDRRQGDRPDRPPAAGSRADGRRPLPDLGRADGRRGRLRRRAVARGRAGRRRRGRLPQGAHHPLDLPGGLGVRVPNRRRRSRRASTAAPSGPSRRSTRACSRRRWTPPPRGIPMSSTSRC